MTTFEETLHEVHAKSKRIIDAYIDTVGTQKMHIFLQINEALKGFPGIGDANGIYDENGIVIANDYVRVHQHGKHYELGFYFRLNLFVGIPSGLRVFAEYKKEPCLTPHLNWGECELYNATENDVREKIDWFLSQNDEHKIRNDFPSYKAAQRLFSRCGPGQ
jgi:hypothetical protein